MVCVLEVWIKSLAPTSSWHLPSFTSEHSAGFNLLPLQNHLVCQKQNEKQETQTNKQKADKEKDYNNQ